MLTVIGPQPHNVPDKAWRGVDPDVERCEPEDASCFIRKKTGEYVISNEALLK
ncbi:hypothetical protein P7K49_020800 [Saguinus oedipus]|uniref:Uncharacterized protein n=1 Tax=Saguinus oedipus TaxID=9490 RepID=A0ABQ9UQU4_SAGOE|nr:hypothetical protein P7K49_020800 [Saguinus oedipus]